LQKSVQRSILVVDDDPVQRRLLEAIAAKAGYGVMTASGGAEALALLDRRPDAIVLDLVMPGMSGTDVLDALARRVDAPPVIVQTAKGSIDTAVSAMRAGAFDFVVKPVSPERLMTALANAVRLNESEIRAREARPPAKAGTAIRELVGASPAMAAVARLAEKAAGADIPVLIEGESGVGKELVARAIRDGSARRDQPFVTVNCGAIPENLVESILFGHEKGSFTGATDRHVGKFVEADGGTLFLDEIGDLPPAAQVKLLRAVQEGEVEPVGARTSVKVDIRLISATHRDLSSLVAEGTFREDLFYRLAVFPVQVPPLRARRNDIAPLARHFLTRIAREQGGRVRDIDAEALDLLCRYDWPGNVRQLENAMFRAVVLSDGEVLGASEFPQIRAQLGEVEAWTEEFSAPLPAPAASAHAFDPLDARGHVRELAEMEDHMIRFAIDHYEGRMSEVARRLGIGRSTLYRKLKDLGIDAGRDTDYPDDRRAG
jgi:DNA-binding NtrC family response regulator